MSTRYWVGGAGTWDASTTTNWSATSGGAGGASAPTSTDDVVIDTSSGTGAITCSGAVCQNLTVTATQALALLNNYSDTLGIYGSLSIVSGGSFTVPANASFGAMATITFNSTNTTKSIVTGGKTFPNCKFTGASDIYNLGDNFTLYILNIQGGTFNTNNYNITVPTVPPSIYGVPGSSIAVSSGVFNMGSSTINISATAGGAFNAYAGTLNAGTSTINMTGASYDFNGGGRTYYSVNLAGDAGNFSGNNTFTNLTVSKFLVLSDASITVTGTFTANGTNPLRITILGNGYTITAATVSMSYVNFFKVIAAGTGSWTGTSIGDLGGNSGITFATAKTVYAVSGGSPNWGDNIWSTSSGGSVSMTNFPLPQDTVIIDDNSCANGGTISSGGINSQNPVSNVTFSTRTNSVIIGDNFIFNGTTVFSSAVSFVGAALSFGGYCTFNANGAPINVNVYVAYRYSTITLTGNCTLNGSGAPGYIIVFRCTQKDITLDLNGYTLTATGNFLNSGTGFTLAGTGGGTLNSTCSNNNYGDYAVGLGNSTSTGTPVITSNFAGNRSLQVPDGDNVNVNIQNSGSALLRNSGSGNIKNLNFTGFTGTFDNFGLNLVGDLTLVSGGTYASGSFTFKGTSGTSTITTAGVTLILPLNFDCAGKTYVFADALTQGSTTTFTITNGTVKFKASTTNTVGSFLTTGTNIKYLASTTSGTRATVTQASGAVSVSYLAIKDSAATGGATWNASYGRSNINQGNNTGWVFSSNTGSFFFLMG